jgi:hypothetical protein
MYLEDKYPFTSSGILLKMNSSLFGVLVSDAALRSLSVRGCPSGVCP